MYRDDDEAQPPRDIRWPWWRPPEPEPTFGPADALFFRRIDSAATGRASTRAFLAREVYGVPEVWLDEVLRVRMADLE